VANKLRPAIRTAIHLKKFWFANPKTGFASHNRSVSPQWLKHRSYPVATTTSRHSIREWQIAQLTYPTGIVDNQLITAPMVSAYILDDTQSARPAFPGYLVFLAQTQQESTCSTFAQCFEFEGISLVTHRRDGCRPIVIAHIDVNIGTVKTGEDGEMTV
jgi:hypothetical protein